MSLINHHAMKTYKCESGGVAPYILNIDNKWRGWSAARHGRFTPWESDPLKRRLGGTQSGLERVEEKSLPLQGDETP
jgi:hypothetical protein